MPVPLSKSSSTARCCRRACAFTFYMPDCGQCVIWPHLDPFALVSKRSRAQSPCRSLLRSTDVRPASRAAPAIQGRSARHQLVPVAHYSKSRREIHALCFSDMHVRLAGIFGGAPRWARHPLLRADSRLLRRSGRHCGAKVSHTVHQDVAEGFGRRDFFYKHRPFDLHADFG